MIPQSEFFSEDFIKYAGLFSLSLMIPFCSFFFLSIVRHKV